jgi:hypothetical protein
MAEVNITQDQFRALVQMTTTYAEVLTATDRQGLLEMAGLGEFKTRLDFGTSARNFSVQLIRTLQDYGTLASTGQPALVSLLRELRDKVKGRSDDVALIDSLLAPYGGASTTASPKVKETGSCILFLAANPKGTGQIRLDEEARTIEERLREASLRDRFDLKTAWAVRWGDLSRCLLEYQPKIVHFSGHGASSSEIILEADRGGTFIVPADTLNDLFRILKDDIRCVVLNACWSERQAQAIAQHIDCVVGMTRPVEDEAAIHFAAGFYRGLGFGRSVQTAFDLGVNELAALVPSNRDIPRLIVRSGVDAASLKLI